MRVFSNKRRQAIDIIFALGLFCVFAVSALLVVQIGSTTYGSNVENTESIFSSRTAISYVEKQVKQHDTVGGVTIGTLEEIPALLLKTEIDGETYINYIYYYEGSLRELFAKEGATVSAALGEELIPLKEFEMQQVAEGIYAFSVVDNNDAKSQTIISVRSEE